MKRSFLSKALCTTLAILLLLQALPLSVFANDYGSLNDVETDGILNITETESLEISCEIIDSRTEFSKVFLLSDDTFYNINTTYPLHARENDMWIDLYEGFEDVNTVDEIKELVGNIETVSNASVSLTSETSNYSSNADIEPLINSDICWATEYEAYEIAAPDGALRITPNTVVPYTAKNQVINSAYLNFSRAEIDNPIETLVTIYEGDENVTSSNINFLKIIDEFTATSINEYSVDITNLYAKWDIDATPFYGVVLRARGNDFFTIRNAYFEVYFEEIDWNDTDYTYRTIDLGDAGLLSINNYTNTILLENKLFKLDSKVFPVCLSRINDSANPNTSGSAGFGFTWNIESTISVSGNLGVWNTVDLEKKYFIPDETISIENGYQVWKEADSNGIEDQTSIYFFVPNNDVINNTIDYSRIYIKQGDTKYSFDTNGRMISVERPGVNNILLSLEISYDETGKLESITTENGKVYDFDYLYNSQLRKYYLWKVFVNGSATMFFGRETHVDSSLIYAPDYVYECLWYGENGETIEDSDVYFVIDKMGSLVWAKDIGNKLWNFENVNYGDRDRNVGNRVKSYTEYKQQEDDESRYAYNITVSFDMPNGNYREITELDYISNNETSEIIQYDKEHRIITHKEPTGRCICVEYDENGIVSSFAFNESEDNFIQNNSFESEMDSQYDWRVSDTNVELVTSTWDGGEHGNKEMKISLEDIGNSVVTQSVEGNFYADKTYVVGAWIKVDQTIPIEDRKIGIQVFDATNNNTAITFGTIDNGLDGEWQYRLQAFKLSNDCTELLINLTALNQCGEIRFDEVTLFEAKDSKTDLNGIEISSAIEKTYENGMVSKETITNGVYSLNKSYEYYNDGCVSKINDINGLNTYYAYSHNENGSGTTSIGTIKDDSGNIIDVKEIEYNAMGYLSKITQTINAINETTSSEGETSNSLNMSSKYSWLNDEQIKSVEHNGILYNFTYTNKRKLSNIKVSVDCDSSNNSEEEINYENEHSIVNYSYLTNGKVSTITYTNDYKLTYRYNNTTKNKEIKCVECYYENNLVAKYTYNYLANSNVLISITYEDSEETYTIGYDVNGNIEFIEANETVVYLKEENENGEIVEHFEQAYFTGSNNTTTDTITTTNTITSDPNSSNGNITNSSTILVNKNASDNKYSEMIFERSSITDYFNRIINKETLLVYNTGDESETTYNVGINTDYEYKLLDVGVTSGLVSGYETSVSGDNGIPNSTPTIYSSYSRNYEYDHKGNINYVYTLSNNIETPCEYYEYDEANQLIASIDFARQEVVKYSYDEGGNLTLKEFYVYNTLQFDCENRDVINWGTQERSIVYSFHEKSNDSENNTIPDGSFDTFNTVIGIEEIFYTETLENREPIDAEIEYDSLGNPLNYIGIDIDNNIVTGSLSWKGYSLHKFENENMIIEYQYDKDGHRSKKIVYSKNTDGSTSLTYKMTYIWNGDVIASLIYQGGDSESVNLNIIYDQEGTPTGYITSFGIPYYFIKDVNENVVGLVHPNGTMLCSISYDAWGTPNYVFYGDNFIAKAVAKATAIFNPVTYHGYIYDYETGMYYSEGQFYSPLWGRYINSDELISFNKDSKDVLDANLYLFSNNNPINNVDTCAMWSRNHFNAEYGYEYIIVDESDLFSSRAFCTVFANQFVEEYGEYSAGIGYHISEMTSFELATALFAHYVARKAPQAINKVNSYWGDGWMLDSQNTERIEIFIASDESTWQNDAWKFEKIWYAAKEIKKYAWEYGVNITI